MNKNTLALLMSSALLVPVAAFAADDAGFYVGGAYSMVNYDDSTTSDDASINVISLRGGYQINEGLAVEARYGAGVSDDKIGNADIKLEVDDIYGVYLKAGVQTPIGFYPYVLLGWTEVDLKASAGGDSVKDNGGDYSLGLGVDYRFGAFSVGVEYAQMYDKGDYKVNGLSLGASYKF